MSNLRERPRNGTSSLEDDVILLVIRQAFVEWGQQFEVGRLESLDKRMTRMGADLRQLKRAQAGLPAEKAPDHEIHRRAQPQRRPRVIYQVSSSKVPIKRWFESREEAIAAFEHQCKHLGLEPPLDYPPAVSGDTFEDNGIAYPRRTRAAGMRAGLGFVFVEERNP